MNQSYKVDHNTLKVNRTTLTVNQLVVGSIPTAGAIRLKSMMYKTVHERFGDSMHQYIVHFRT